MRTIDTLRQAIRERRAVRFSYLRPGLPRGERIGNPHALYFAGNGELLCDLLQTYGVSGHESDLPEWRTLIVDAMDLVEIARELPSFVPHAHYHSGAPRYENTLKRIQESAMTALSH